MNTFKSLVLALILSHAAKAFVAPSTNTVAFSKTLSRPAAVATQINMVPVDMDTFANLIKSAPSMMLSETAVSTEPWVKPMSQILGPFLNIFSFAMVSFKGRWYGRIFKVVPLCLFTLFYTFFIQCNTLLTRN